MSYPIPEHMVGEFESKMNRVVRRARKLGLPEPAWSLSDVYETPTETGDGMERWVTVTLTGAPSVKLEGWEFAGLVEHVRGTDKNIVKEVPGFDLPVHMRTDRPTCDHCQKARYRKTTYVVKHEDGSYMRVGKNCLRDFLGGHDPKMIVQACNTLNSVYRVLLDDLEGWGKAPKISPLLSEYLTFVAREIRLNGYVSRAKCVVGLPTSEMAERIMDLFRRGDTRGNEAPTESDAQLALDTIEWARNLTDTTSSYLHNVHVVCSLRSVDSKSMGIAASAVMAYRRELEKKALQSASEGFGESFHIGTVKARFGGAKKGSPAPLPVLVTRAHTFDGNFGPTTVVSAVVREGEHVGARILTFRTGSVDIKPGAQALVTGTVKRHQTDRDGNKETLLSRTSWADA